MLIRKEDARRHENSPNCIVWEHDHQSKDLSYATAMINGRYPTSKKVTNLECDEILFAISGKGMVHSNNGDFPINPMDSFYIPKGDKYWIEGERLILGITTSPSWTPEQYKEVD